MQKSSNGFKAYTTKGFNIKQTSLLSQIFDSFKQWWEMLQTLYLYIAARAYITSGCSIGFYRIKLGTNLFLKEKDMIGNRKSKSKENDLLNDSNLYLIFSALPSSSSWNKSIPSEFMMQFKLNNPWRISPSLLEYVKAVMSFVQNRFPLWISLSTSHLCFQYLQSHSHKLVEILGVNCLSNPTIVNWLSLDFLICQQVGICQILQLWIGSHCIF